MSVLVRSILAIALAASIWAATTYFVGRSATTTASTISGESELPAPSLDSPDRSPAQQAALADGVITWEEYEVAVYARVECVRSHGIPISEPTRQPGKVLRATAGPFASFEEMEAAGVNIRACDIQHLGGVALQWAIQNAPSQEEHAAAREALAACLRESGVAVPADVETVHFSDYHVEYASQFGRCSNEVSEQFDLPSFGG